MGTLRNIAVVHRDTKDQGRIRISFAIIKVLPIKGFSGVSDGQESSYSAGDPGSIFGLSRSPGEENGHPLQYSCLENFTDRRALWTIVQGGHKESDTTE